MTESFSFCSRKHATDMITSRKRTSGSNGPGNLPGIKNNQGGVRERRYNHSVHRIEMPRSDGTIEEYYFVLEYATPLMSLYDMSVQERDHQVNCLIC